VSAVAKDVRRVVGGGGELAKLILGAVPPGGIAARDLRNALRGQEPSILDIQLQALVRRGALQLVLGRYLRPDLPRLGSLPVDRKAIAVQVEKANKDRIAAEKRRYYEANKDRIAAEQRRYREANKDRIAAEKRRYREANKDRIAAEQRRYREANKDRIAAEQRRYYEANKDRIAAEQRRYREANKDRIAAEQRRYREANKDRIAAEKRRYYEQNRERWRTVYAPRQRERRKKQVVAKVRKP